MSDDPKILKWFEVTWVQASGRTLVKAEDEGVARMLASQHAEDSARMATEIPIVDGRSVLHQWTEVADNDPMIFDVEELAEDTAAELKREMEDR